MPLCLPNNTNRCSRLMSDYEVTLVNDNSKHLPTNLAPF